jgi:hypothetical protein
VGGLTSIRLQQPTEKSDEPKIVSGQAWMCLEGAT